MSAQAEPVVTDDGLARLAQAVRARRQALGLTQKDAASAAEVSDTTWLSVEAGKPASRRTYKGVSEALGWPPDSASNLAAGGDEPTVVDPDPDSQFLARVRDAWIQEIAENTRLLGVESMYVVAGVESWMFWWERESFDGASIDYHALADFLGEMPSLEYLGVAARRSVQSMLDAQKRADAEVAAEVYDLELDGDPDAPLVLGRRPPLPGEVDEDLPAAAERGDAAGAREAPERNRPEPVEPE